MFKNLVFKDGCAAAEVGKVVWAKMEQRIKQAGDRGNSNVEEV